MKNQKLIIFSVITIIVIIAASIISKLQAPDTENEKELLLPQLETRINDVAAITVKGNKRTVNLQKIDNIWVIKEADNYPAVFEKVKDTVISLSAFKVIAEKTDNPELYSRLNVQGPEQPDSLSLLITLKDASDNTISSLIIGSPQHSKAANNKPGLYVRRPEEKQALLVEGTLFITDQVTDWFDQNILDIPSSVIREVSIKHPDGDELNMARSAREAPEFELIGDIEKDKSVYKIILNRISTALEELRADGVTAIRNFNFSEDAVVTTFTTFDGLVITVKSMQIDEKPYAHFSFDVDDELAASVTAEGEQESVKDKIENEASILNSVLSDWVYQIPDFKYQDLTKKIDNITTSMEIERLENIEQPAGTLDQLDFPR